MILVWFSNVMYMRSLLFVDCRQNEMTVSYYPRINDDNEKDINCCGYTCYTACEEPCCKQWKQQTEISNFVFNLFNIFKSQILGGKTYFPVIDSFGWIV